MESTKRVLMEDLFEKDDKRMVLSCQPKEALNVVTI